MNKKQLIGIFGGTFNPIHNLHLEMAKKAKKTLGLKKIFFVPAARPPHKKLEGNASFKKRYKMTRLALKPYLNFSVSSIELRQAGKSYSIKTVETFKKKFRKDTQFFFIIGSDSLAEIFTWKNINKLLQLCKFIVFKRPGYPIVLKNRRLLDRVEIISMRPQKNSSTEIRKRIKENRDISKLVPKSVFQFIHRNRLYQ